MKIILCQPARALHLHLALLAALCFGTAAFAADSAPQKIIRALFMGDTGHHVPRQRFAQLQPIMDDRGIQMTYTQNMADFNPETLSKYDCVIVYANTVAIEPEQEKALLDFVAGGKGFVPIHCASFCFQNSPKYIELVGGQFNHHSTGEFTVDVAKPDHPIMKGLEGFKTWDETYVHIKHNPDHVVLQTHKEKDGDEPWTWVRTQGKGRVFYTAYGHDERTWGNPGFQALLERGIRWSCGDDNPIDTKPAVVVKRTDVKPFQYTEANVPFYSPSGAGTGQTWNKMQLPLDAAESMKHLVVPPDFEVQLYASEPEIAKPIAMTWDHKGRLWIAETIDYPNNKQPNGEGHDRITICEDTDGDGRADKFTVFADKLSIPTSLAFGNGGLIVHQMPETLFLKDSTGGDKADVRKVLFSGWGTGDTHAGPSNLHYGFDNWIWGIVGYSSFSGEVGGEKSKFGAGFYRFKPDGSKLEFLRSNNNNSWGLGFTEDGLAVGSTANGNPSVYMPIPNRYYESVRGWSAGVLSTIADSLEIHPITDKVRQVDWHGKFTAAAGSGVYTARTYPREYWNQIQFVNEPTGHVSAMFKLERDGTDFKAHNTAKNLVASDDEWTAPIFAEVGPDGNIWVIDWYNYIIQHNPVPHGFSNGRGNAYETPLRDKTHGRIYRIVYKGTKGYHPMQLDPQNVDSLLAALKNDNLFWRLTAQRMLIERANLDVVPALIKLTQDQSVDQIGLSPGALHALWTLQGLGALDGSNEAANSAAVASLKHPAAAVRRAALLVLPRKESSVAPASAMLSDADAHVRLAAFLRLAELPRADSAGAAIASAIADAANANDRWIPEAATSAAAAHDIQFLKAFAARKLENAPPAQALQIAALVAEHYSRGSPADTLGTLLASLIGGDPRAQDAIIAGLAKGWPKDAKAKLDDEGEKALIKLITDLSPNSKSRMASLASRWGSTALEKYSAEISAALLAKAQSENESDASRIAASAQLIEFRKSDTGAVRDLFKLITPRSSPEFATGIIEAISRSESAEGAEVLVDGLAQLGAEARRAAETAMLSRGDWTAVFMKGVESGKALLSDLSLDQKQALAAHPNKTISESAKKLLAKGGGLPDADRQKVIDELSPKVLQKGDAAKGKLVFKQNCMKCHTHSGEGAKIGPELTGMNTHTKAELLIDILDPSRSVEGNFRQYTLITTDGRVLIGLLSSETKTSVEILDTEGKTHPVQRNEIKKLVASPKSLMPEGFEKQIPPESLTDLLEFLTQRGKFMPIDLHKSATIVSTKGMFFGKESAIERMIFPDWSPKTFDGVPFNLVDPQGDKINNVILLYGPNGESPPKMPKEVSLPCNSPAKAIHLLSGVSGWGATAPHDGSVSMIVRLHYGDGSIENHELKDGVHFADYIRKIDVPESKFAFALRGQQIRYLAIHPRRPDAIKEIELVKGNDHTAPIVMAVTVETLD